VHGVLGVRRSALVALAGGAGLALSASAALVGAPPAAAAPFERAQGADRYATAVALSQRTHPGTSEFVVVASGEGFADALAGAPGARALEAPLLLTSRAALPAAVRTEVARLQPLEVLVLGGPAAVSDAVVAELEGLGTSVSRVFGESRYDTAAQIAYGVVAPDEESATPEVVVASGEGFADGLAGGAYGAATGSPLLLTARGALPEETAFALEVLAPGAITVLGGTSVVSAQVEAELAQHTDGPVTRVFGADRYETAAAVARRFPGGSGGAVGAVPLLAAGAGFPDALAGAAVGAPLLLSERDCLPRASAAALEALGARSVLALGGPAVLSDAAASGSVCGQAAPPPPPPPPPPPQAPPVAPPAQPPPAQDLDCPDFATQAEAQATYDRLHPQHGDVHRLDGDDDGIACESHFG
jgi:putative cell wall-binding protein